MKRLSSSAAAVGVVLLAIVWLATRRSADDSGCPSVPVSDSSLASNVRASLRLAGPSPDGGIGVMSTFAASHAVSLSGNSDQAYLLNSHRRIVARVPTGQQGTDLDLRLAGGQSREVSTPVVGMKTCGGDAVTTLPGGSYRLIVTYSLIDGDAPIGTLVSSPTDFTLIK